MAPGKRTQSTTPAVENAIEESLQQPHLPESNLPNGDPQDIGFFDRVASLTPGEWPKHSLYVYMVLPKIDLGNDSHYLARYGRPIDEEGILAAHGSGRFYCVLNDKKARKAIASCTFSVYRADCPPKVNPSQILRCPENEPYLAWVNTPQPGTTSAPAAQDGGTAVSALADIAKNAQQNERSAVDQLVLGMWKEVAAERDELAKKLAEHQTIAAAPTATPIDPLALLERAFGIVEKANKFKTEGKEPISEGTRSIDQLTAQLDFFKQAKELFGAAELASTSAVPEDDSFWATLAKSFSPALTALAGPIGQAIGTKMIGPTTTPGATPVPHPRTHPPATHGSPAGPDQQSATAEGTGEESATSSEALDPEIAFLLPIFQHQGASFVAAFANDPDSGPDIARTVALFAGQATYERIARMGREKILATIALIPALAQDLLQVGTLEMLSDFVDDFIDPPSDAESEDDRDPLPLATAPNTHGKATAA